MIDTMIDEMRKLEDKVEVGERRRSGLADTVSP